LARYLNDSDAEVQQVARGRAERTSRPVRASGALRAIAGDLPPEG
jgi:hypothetical protein